MHIFFAISIICLPVWAGIALTRRIRAGRQLDRTSRLRLDFVQHLFNAVNDERSLEPRKVTYQTFRDITSKKSWNQSPDVVTVRPSHKLRLDFCPSGTEELQLKRKPPQILHPTRPERLDWAYFNRDSGGLTNPHQTSSIRANARN